MSELAQTEAEVPERWVQAWSTTSFQAATVGRATLSHEGVDRLSLPIVGWLCQHDVAYEENSKRVASWPVSHQRIVPGFLGSSGEVVPLEAIQVRGVEGEVAWTLRLDGGDVSGTQDLVVNVVVQPADVVVMPEPATRRVVRDSYGQISAVVAEP